MTASLELVKDFAAALNDEAAVGTAWLRQAAAEDIVWEVEAMHLPDVGRVEGREAVIRAFESWRSPWDRIVVTTHALEEIDRFVIWHYSHEFVQEASGLHFDGTVAVLIEFRDGLVARMRWFWDLDEARAAAAGG